MILKLFRQALLICFLIFFPFFWGCGGGNGDGGGNGGGSTGTISLAWDANSESDLAGYKLYYGTASGVYSNSVDVGMATQSGGTVTYTLTGLTSGQIYYIVATAYDTSNNESGYSNEVNGAAK
jgi:hypothetical protein